MSAASHGPSRVQRIAFAAVVTIGTLGGLVLGLREVNDRSPLRLGDERVRTEGLVSTVQVAVRNTSDDTTYCPEIRVAALDREGLDLDEQVALPDLGALRLEPGDSANFVAVLADISEQDYAEQLDDFSAFVVDENPC